MATKRLKKWTSVQHQEMEGEKAEVCQDRPQGGSMEVFSSVHDAPRDTSVPIADVHPSVVSQAVRPTSQQPADCPYCGTHFKQARNIQRHLDSLQVSS